MRKEGYLKVILSNTKLVVNITGLVVRPGLFHD